MDEEVEGHGNGDRQAEQWATQPEGDEHQQIPHELRDHGVPCQQTPRGGSLLQKIAVSSDHAPLSSHSLNLPSASGVPMVRPHDSRESRPRPPWELCVGDVLGEEGGVEGQGENPDGVEVAVDREVGGQEGRATEVVVGEGGSEGRHLHTSWRVSNTENGFVANEDRSADR
jgi:hypothetical protein